MEPLDYDILEDDVDYFNYSSESNDNSTLLVNSTTTVPIELSSAILKGVILGSICIITILGNVLVLMAVFVNSHLRSTTNYFIVNLAIADVLLGSLVLPFSASIEIVDYWAFGQTFCDIWAATDVLCCTASILSLCVISIDRYIGVTRPLQHSSIMTEKRAVYIIIGVWVMSVIISVAPLIGWKDPPDPNPYVCTVTQQIGYVIFSVAGSFYIPLLIILIVYFRIYKEAEKQYRFLSTGIKTSKLDENTQGVTLRIHTGRSAIAVAAAATAASSAPLSSASMAGSGVINQSTNPCYQSSSSSEHSDSSGRKSNSRLTLAGRVAKFRRERKAAKTLGIVVGVFILCWFPFFFVLPLGALCEACQIPDLMFKIIFWLGYCNSTMNPVIYACSSKEFKRAFKRILQCQLRRRPRSFLQEPCVASSVAELHTTPNTRQLVRSFSRKFRKQQITLRKKAENSLKRGGSLGGKTIFRQRLTEESPLKDNLCPESPIPSLRLFHKKRKELSELSIRQAAVAATVAASEGEEDVEKEEGEEEEEGGGGEEEEEEEEEGETGERRPCRNSDYISSEDEKSDNLEEVMTDLTESIDASKLFNNGSRFSDDEDEEDYLNTVLTKRCGEQLAKPFRLENTFVVPKIVIQWDSDSEGSKIEDIRSTAYTTQNVVGRTEV